MKYSFLYIFLVISLHNIQAQYDHIPVYPSLSGDDLMEAVVDDFKPETILTYGPARDTLYAKIDAKNDSVECVYTGLKLYLDPSLDPTQALFLDGDINGINTEHTYPQSKGAENGNARSDMHHLYPTRNKTNNDRGSLPFGDIPDAETDIWYFMTMEQSFIPENNIDNYSEGTDVLFEPRESHKGDVARSMMYFFTMYRNEALAADPDYFELQKDVLCQWHYQDEVDQKEWERTMAIALYQEGKPNPFVLDCTLAARTYCGEASSACQLTDIDEVNTESIDIFPNPAYDKFYIRTPESPYNYFIYNRLGQRISAGVHDGGPKLFNISEWPSGIYFIQISHVKRMTVHSFTLIVK